ncbi:hypothetical protein ACVIRM_005403 [Rhizobium laguerreae]
MQGYLQIFARPRCDPTKDGKRPSERHGITCRQQKTAPSIQSFAFTRQHRGDNRIERENAWRESQQDPKTEKGRK